MSSAPTVVDEPIVEDRVEPDVPWIVVVWNDPINLMSYVTWVFQKLYWLSAGEGGETDDGRPHQGQGRRRERAARALRSRRRRAPRLRPVGDLPEGSMNIAITPAGGGAVMVELPEDLRDLLASLAKQLSELIDDPDAADDPGMARLFPPASVDDPMEALGFEQL